MVAQVMKSVMQGKEGEGYVLRYMMSKGRILVEVGALGDEGFNGHAPSVYVPNGQSGYRLTAPDFLTINPSVIPDLWTQDNIWNFPFLWTEVKHKSGCSFYRQNQRWQTGIDRRHYEHYCLIQTYTKIPVWLFFFHSDAIITQPVPQWALPMPVGLFACPVTKKPSDDWKDPSYEKKGYRDMVYWGVKEDLIQLATLEEVLNASRSAA